MEERAASWLRQFAGLALPDHRWPLLRATLESVAPDGTVEEALARLEAGDQAARQAVLAGITVPETFLFRHPAHFEALAEHARAAAGRVAPYRVLSAGCATGEEAWSAAAVLDEVGRTMGLCWKVLGWDLDADRIARARAGWYSAWSARSGLLGYDGAFEPRGRGWQVHPRLRGQVSFECVNLKIGPLPSAACFDVVFLRNVAIYWAPECVAEMLGRVANLVTPGGLLLIGAAETETLDRAEWTIEWRGAVRIASRRPTQAPMHTSAMAVPLIRATINRKSAGRAAAPSTATPSAATPVGSDPLDRVQELADRGRYVEALSILEDLPPAPDPERYLWRGILCLNLLRPQDALSCLRKAVFLAPLDVVCRHWLAIALSACGCHDAAAREQRNLRELSA